MIPCLDLKHKDKGNQMKSLTKSNIRKWACVSKTKESGLRFSQFLLWILF